MSNATPHPTELRTELYADPTGVFVHDAVLSACRIYGEKVALIDGDHRISYAKYGELVENVARALITAGVSPGDRIGILLPNSWEFAVTYHAATLAAAAGVWAGFTSGRTSTSSSGVARFGEAWVWVWAG